MAELGVDVRVWIGYTASVDPDISGCRCDCGVIVDGPFVPGVVQLVTGLKGKVTVTRWNILTDSGDEVSASEDILFPIDDGDPIEQDIEEEMTA